MWCVTAREKGEIGNRTRASEREPGGLKSVQCCFRSSCAYNPVMLKLCRVTAKDTDAGHADIGPVHDIVGTIRGSVVFSVTILEWGSTVIKMPRS